jgi:hypothetical protein
VENPLDETLLELADVLYERLDAAFESAPISDELASNWMMDRRLSDESGNQCFHNKSGFQPRN